METLLNGRIKMRRIVNALLHTTRQLAAADKVPADVRALVQQLLVASRDASVLLVEQQTAVERQHYLLVGAARKRASSALDDPSCSIFRPLPPPAKRQTAMAIGTRKAAAGTARRVGRAGHGAVGRKPRPRQA